MAEIVNLNHIRKARQKAEKAAQSTQNRVRHGRRKDDRRLHDSEDDRRRRDLDGRRLGDDVPGGDEPA
jgi:hypothetical protein